MCVEACWPDFKGRYLSWTSKEASFIPSHSSPQTSVCVCAQVSCRRRTKVLMWSQEDDQVTSSRSRLLALLVFLLHSGTFLWWHESAWSDTKPCVWPAGWSCAAVTLSLFIFIKSTCTNVFCKYIHIYMRLKCLFRYDNTSSVMDAQTGTVPNQRSKDVVVGGASFSVVHPEMYHESRWHCSGVYPTSSS